MWMLHSSATGAILYQAEKERKDRTGKPTAAPSADSTLPDLSKTEQNYPIMIGNCRHHERGLRIGDKLTRNLVNPVHGNY